MNPRLHCSCDYRAAKSGVVVEHVVHTALVVDLKLGCLDSELLRQAVVDGLRAVPAEFLVDFLVARSGVGVAADGEPRPGGLQDLGEKSEVDSGLLGEGALPELEPYEVWGGDRVGGLDDLRPGLEPGQLFLKSFALGFELGEGELVGGDVGGLHHLHHLAPVPAARLELVGEADGGGEVALAPAVAKLAVKSLVDHHPVDVDVEVESVAEPEGVVEADVAADLAVLRLLRVNMRQTDPDERRRVPEVSLRLVAADDVGEVEHHVGVDVPEAELLPLEPVAVSPLPGTSLPVE